MNVTLIALLIEDLQVREEFALLMTMVVLVPIHYFLSRQVICRLTPAINPTFLFLFFIPQDTIRRTADECFECQSDIKENITDKILLKNEGSFRFQAGVGKPGDWRAPDG